MSLAPSTGGDATNKLLDGPQALQDSSPNNFVKWDVTPHDDGIMQEPKACHRVCIRHVQSNFMTKVKYEVLKAKLGDVAYEKKEFKFKEKFAELLQLLHDKPLARKCLEDMDVELWTQAFDQGGFRWGSMTTNASDCFNKILKNGHDLQVSSLVIYTFKQTSAYFMKCYQSTISSKNS
ncbi:hypothetical protein QQ045_031043 [Rhodiola kirilowii]